MSPMQATALIFPAEAIPQTDQPEGRIAFVSPTAAEIQSSLLEWLAQARVDSETARRAASLWADRELTKNESAEELLDRIVATLAVADSSVQRFLDACHAADGMKTVKSPDFDGIRAEPFFRYNVQLFHARWLTQHRFFDEALEILESLAPEQVVDPASLFFYRAICQQRLLQHQQAEESLLLLLNHTVDVPDRFRAVAGIMSRELQDQATEKMDQVARLMSDVQRRLDLGRSGKKVQEQEDQIVAMLDDLLEEMQNQQQQSGGGAGGGSQNQPGQQGAADSQIKGSAAEGTADRRELSESGAWGMLDKQTEAQARELIRQTFPANYLDAISRYTKKIAERK